MARRSQPKTESPNPQRAADLPAEPSATISAEELCALTGLTDRRHRQLAQAGHFPPPLRGQYQRDKTVAGLFQYFRLQLKKRDDTLRVEQRKLAKAKREKTEEELAIIRNRYVLKSEIGPALHNVSLHQRATLQFKLENELAPNLAGKTPLEILEEIRRAVDAICGVFNEGVRRWMDSAP